MKRLFFALTLALTVFAGSAFANDGGVSPRVQKSFESAFSNAKDVNWSMVENLYLAEFKVDGQQVSAFYDAEGVMIATARHLPVVQLPISLQTSLKKHAEGFAILDIFELNNADGISYYATLESASKSVMLKSTFNSDWTTYKKTKK